MKVTVQILNDCLTAHLVPEELERDFLHRLINARTVIEGRGLGDGRTFVSQSGM